MKEIKYFLDGSALKYRNLKNEKKDTICPFCSTKDEVIVVVYGVLYVNTEN